MFGNVAFHPIICCWRLLAVEIYYNENEMAFTATLRFKFILDDFIWKRFFKKALIW